LAPIVKLRSLTRQEHLLHCRSLFQPSVCVARVVIERRYHSGVKIEAWVTRAFRQRLPRVLLRFGAASGRGEGPRQRVVRKNISPVG
jgi:hypothetical protein